MCVPHAQAPLWPTSLFERRMGSGSARAPGGLLPSSIRLNDFGHAIAALLEAAHNRLAHLADRLGIRSSRSSSLFSGRYPSTTPVSDRTTAPQAARYGPPRLYIYKYLYH